MNFIEIGTCDRKTIMDSEYFDSNSWGLVFEPVAHLLDKLFKHPNVQYVNAAVTADYTGQRPFYLINDPIKKNIPVWVEECGSLHQHPTLKHFNFESFVEEVQVDCIDLDTVYSMITKPIHVLKVDTEGCDFEILNNWDFVKFKPLQLQYESKLMTATEISSLEEKLISFGYTVFQGNKKDFNGIAYNTYAVIDL
jgi:FkbM family methyltransferase